MVSKRTHKKSRSRKNPVVSKNKKGAVTEYIVRKVMTDDAIKKKEGEYFPEKHYSLIVRENCDVYCYEDDDETKKKVLLLKFRKNVLDKDLCQIGIKNLKKAAMKKHDNRGAAAGPLHPDKLPMYANNFKLLKGKSKYRAVGYYSKITKKFVNNSLGNQSMSNIIGYFDKPDRNIKVNAPKCRTTAFSSQQVDKWKKVIPLIQQIDNQFKKLIPDSYNIQYKQAHETPFVIKDTAFSTVTINYNWRTALHTDKGDLQEGFGNLVVLEEGKYEGGYTGFPQYGVCVDVRHGDFLAMDVHKYHANTEIKGITKDYTRLSMVCYLREKMIRCKNM